MKIIAHRGNLNGPNQSIENKPEQIDLAISKGFDVEIDIRYINSKIYLGHDEPETEIDIQFLRERKCSLWIHCKDRHSLEYLSEWKDDKFNYFFHTIEDYILTSKGYIWVYPGKHLLKNSVCVMPENAIKDTISRTFENLRLLNNTLQTSECSGICTDYPILFETKL
jgi:hypothetical protein